jgi:hypothetical protein
MGRGDNLKKQWINALYSDSKFYFGTGSIRKKGA